MPQNIDSAFKKSQITSFENPGTLKRIKRDKKDFIKGREIGGLVPGRAILNLDDESKTIMLSKLEQTAVSVDTHLQERRYLTDSASLSKYEDYSNVP